jgi:hypothetical protein
LFARDRATITVRQGETLVESFGSRALAGVVALMARTARSATAAGEEEVGRTGVVVHFKGGESNSIEINTNHEPV